MFKSSAYIICRANVLKIPAMQYFPAAFKMRLKTTDTSSKEISNAVETEPIHLVNYCLMMSYSGTKYRGMEYQSSFSASTIEGILFKAMFENKWISYDAYKKPFSIRFAHGSRTDKGVSALRQCCSVLLPTGLNVEDINKTLPDDIRVFGLQQVPPTFNARYSCRSRTYTYTLPTIAFSHFNDQSPQKGYRLSAEKFKFINELLQVYKGSKNFHNFTVHKTHDDKSCYRQILNVECDPPFVVDDVEFCTIRLQGRSFMMYQIRKMMGLMLAVAREVTDRSIYDLVFTNKGINCPTSPGLGLVLDRLHFSSFENEPGEQHGKLTWDECEDNVQQFFEKEIKPSIIGTEIRDEHMYEWVETLLNYVYIPEENNNKCDQCKYP